MKITWKKSVISIVVLGFIGIVSANLFTGLSLHPPGEIPGGKYNARFTDHILKSCPTNEFVKGFDNNFDIICAPSYALTYEGPTLSNSHTGNYPLSSPNGEVSGGKLGSFFDKIFGVCPENQIIKGIATNGEKICVDMITPDVFTPPTITTVSSSIIWPNVPTGENERFKSYTANMSNVCGTGLALSGFQTDGTIICSVPHYCKKLEIYDPTTKTCVFSKFVNYCTTPEQTGCVELPNCTLPTPSSDWCDASTVISALRGKTLDGGTHYMKHDDSSDANGYGNISCWGNVSMQCSNPILECSANYNAVCGNFGTPSRGWCYNNTSPMQITPSNLSIIGYISAFQANLSLNVTGGYLQYTYRTRFNTINVFFHISDIAAGNSINAQGSPPSGYDCHHPTGL